LQLSIVREGLAWLQAYLPGLDYVYFI